MAVTQAPQVHHRTHDLVPVNEYKGLPALRLVRTPRSSRVLSRLLTTLAGVIALALIVTPWQQNVDGEGRVVAFAPIERQQTIDAPVDGRVTLWMVVEGQTVEPGEILAEISDNDPDLLQRLDQERRQTAEQADAAKRRVRSLQDRMQGLEDTRETAVAAARQRVQMARDRVGAAEQALAASEAARIAAELNWERQGKLGARGLASTRAMEVAEAEFRQAGANVLRARNGLSAAQAELLSMESELDRTDADARARIEEGRASLDSAVSDAAKAAAELTKLDVRIARQSTQTVRAPMAGTVLRVMAGPGEFVKSATPLMVLVPASGTDVVEIFVVGRDIPLIHVGDKVRLQFEGWPAVQFAGWPSVAVGTFGGEVMLVDPTDDGKGRFRILVRPDPDDEPWPDKRYLRQGVRAHGWVLLKQVPMWFEIWRHLNGFPPTVSDSEPSGSKKS
ncbi:MAG: HlyD family efflux transporter periplasmic adaptor subunit [Bryobacterales bacterium]|nr:HlyD family efflux transporter periplasmic adaptor subunit [Bryobacterales bacterium]